MSLIVTARIAKGVKLIGREAMAAHEAGLGTLYVTCGGEIALKPYGYRTPLLAPEKHDAVTQW
jgi:hypothetical protein